MDEIINSVDLHIQFIKNQDERKVRIFGFSYGTPVDLSIKDQQKAEETFDRLYFSINEALFNLYQNPT